MRFAAVLIWIIAALLIACSSESTSPLPQVRNETSTDARPSVAATATELPTAMPAAETTPAQSVPPATMDPTNPPTTTEAPGAQPVTETAPTATPQEPTATAPPTENPTPEPHLPTPTPTALPARPTATSTGAATVLRVTVSAVPATLPDYDRQDWKHWTDADRDCQDARNEVLIAESQTRVAYRTDRKCRVAAGEWLALYSNTIVTDPGKLDVDQPWCRWATRTTAEPGNGQPTNGSSTPTTSMIHSISSPSRPAPTARKEHGDPRPVETGRPVVLVPVRSRLDHDQGHLGTHRHSARVRRSGRDGQHLRCPDYGVDTTEPT